MIHGGNMSMEKLLQKSLCYEHHQNNYQDSLASDLIPVGLKINKPPAIETAIDDFDLKWKNILYNTEKRLVELLLLETSKFQYKYKFKYKRLNTNSKI